MPRARLKNAALPLTLLAAFFVVLVAGCRSPRVERASPDAIAHEQSRHPGPVAHTYTPSPHRVVGYILEIDEARGFVIVEVTAEPLPPELQTGADLTVRTRDLQKTAHLSATRFLRGHTLGATIVTGLPAVGEEVVLLAN